ncbi:propanol-preferring alcohol dehydrogenase [Catalinimonas alkaloidigena]|uniref:zinc-dependent alcohol dehydrogenase family protein n=1 Tax=Catalinimonas alkaloidigena TaxID=1075417 RepID=UPI002406B29D|nr:zinc-dependent alcohol dehydrogenase family protein [Catalinimonas alkaloidigena]MDF9796533.1 propanol-preferring alcohol dehydrogenase [Catalinimonas alkaloidigena]
MSPLPTQMQAMVLEKAGEALKLTTLPIPQPKAAQLLIKVHACGVCRTDLHIVDGELNQPALPLIPGHEVIGTVVALGENVIHFAKGDRVGIPWLGFTCGHCRYCMQDKENLCENALFTGYTINGGYAEYMVAYEQYCFPISETYDDLHAAPLMCAGLIGYRSYRMCGDHFKRLGIYGFGAAAHLIAQLAVSQGKEVYAFTRPGDTEGQDFAKKLGAVWAGTSETLPPKPLDAAILFAPVGALLVEALKAIDKGGIVVSGGIHMSDIPSFPYRLLWEERQIRSVANLSRKDGQEYLKLAPQVPVRTEIQTYSLKQANQALNDLRAGNVQGAAVLKI